MQLLTIMTMTTIDDASTMSCGGLVDPETAAAEPVVLWTDPESVALTQGAAAAMAASPPAVTAVA